MEELIFSAAEAQRFYDAGSVAVADVLCRGVLEKTPGDEAARRLLARIAGDFGETEAAAGILAGGRGATTPGERRDGSPERYLLIKGWGSGFCSDVDHTLGALLLAEMMGRTPVIHWGRNSLFTVDRERDAWGEFFDPVSPLTIDDLSGKGHDFWPPKWNDGNLRLENLQKLDGPWSRLSGLQGLNRPERVVVLDYFTGVPTLLPWVRPGHPMHGKSPSETYRYLVGKYLRPRAEILADVERFVAERMPAQAMSPLIAVHIRASDKLREDPQLPQKIAVYPQLIQQFASRNWSSRVFLMTDSASLREQYAKRLGPALVSTECIRTDTQVGLHYQKHQDRRRLGVEVLKDCLLAARCDYFVGLGSSNVSCLIYHLKAWGPRDCAIIGPLMTHMMNGFLYMNHDQLERYLPAEMMTNLRARALEPPLGA